MDFNIEALDGIVPDSVIKELPGVIEKFEIDSVLKLSHFLGQAAHESSNFTAVKENLNYSAEGLKRVFPTYFPDDLADSYARQPQKIGSRVYANRMGNGDEESGDGYTYRGHGYIQITGKDNFQSISDDFNIDFVSDPDLLATDYPLSSAAWFFTKNGIWKICDQGAGDDIVTKITKRVNGGINGLDSRIKFFNQFYSLLS